MSKTPEKRRLLKKRLDRLYKTFDLAYLTPDPLEYLHKFKSRRDREIVGLVASSLAYGRVAGIRKSIERVLDIMEWQPYAFVTGFSPGRDAKKFSGFKHRFSDGKDLSALIYFTRQMIEGSGSVGGFFMEGYDKKKPDIKEALTSFSKRALALNSGGIYRSKSLPKKAGVRYFFPSPRGGSACKRLNLYLRWMVRRGDKLDFGLWKEVSPSALIIPLDTHIARISTNIGLTKRKSADWKMAGEITSALARLDSEDPVKYDFSLSRLGILDKCPKNKDKKLCEACLIREICVL